jgi:hypothetical protein
VLAAFLSICAVGVAFLLRFLFALESDIRTHGTHSARVERIRAHRVAAPSVATRAEPALALVHSHPRLARAAVGRTRNMAS